MKDDMLKVAQAIIDNSTFIRFNYDDDKPSHIVCQFCNQSTPIPIQSKLNGYSSSLIDHELNCVVSKAIDIIDRIKTGERRGPNRNKLTNSMRDKVVSQKPSNGEKWLLSEAKKVTG